MCCKRGKATSDNFSFSLPSVGSAALAGVEAGHNALIVENNEQHCRAIKRRLRQTFTTAHLPDRSN